MKLVLKIVLGLFALLLVVLSIILIPAHFQIRDVTPTLPHQDALLSLRGSDAPSSVSYLLTSSQKLERGQISHISILIEWANGSSFMIDTGMGEQQAEEFAELLSKLDSSAGPVSIKGSIDQLLGDQVHNVVGIGFTHLHIDHSQGITNFCQARGRGATLFQTPNQKNLHNFNTSEGASLAEQSCLAPLEIYQNEGSNLYTSPQFPGIAAIELGGHTPGSTLWAVAMGNKILLFSGDITNDKNSIDHNIPKPALYSYLIVPENTGRTAELRDWLAKLDLKEHFSVIVSHDLGNTQTHLNEFQTR